MKYFGEPLLHIIDYDQGKEVFSFDNKGEFETDNPKIIKFMKEKKWWFKHEEAHLQCKKCDFTCSNKGQLMAHYRENHPKEE